MKIKINKKSFNGRYNEKGQLIIPLEEDEDKYFFKEWQNRAKSGSKKDYIENIDFEKVTECGTLINCFPLLNMNEDFVELLYDQIKNNV